MVPIGARAFSAMIGGNGKASRSVLLQSFICSRWSGGQVGGTSSTELCNYTRDLVWAIYTVRAGAATCELIITSCVFMERCSHGFILNPAPTTKILTDVWPFIRTFCQDRSMIFFFFLSWKIEV